MLEEIKRILDPIELPEIVKVRQHFDDLRLPNVREVLWQKMEAASGNTTAEFMSTHPSSTTRIKQLQKDIPSVQAQLGVTTATKAAY